MLTTESGYAIIRPWKGTRALNERKVRTMKKYGVYFGNWEGTEEEAEFIGTYEECDRYYNDHTDNLGSDEYFEIKEI